MVFSARGYGQYPSIVTRAMIGDSEGMHESMLLSYQVLARVRGFLKAHNGTLVSAEWLGEWISAMLEDMHETTKKGA